MKDNKTLIIALAIAAVAAYYFLVVKKQPEAQPADNQEPQKSQDQIDNESVQANEQHRTELVGSAKTNVTMTQKDEEYNLKRIEYTKYIGEEPPETWTIDMLEQKINDFKATSEMLNEYVRISGDNDRSDEKYWTITDYEKAINNVQTTNKNDWQKRTAELTSLQKQFIEKLDSRGLRASKDALMKDIFPVIETLPENEFVYFIQSTYNAYNKRNIDLFNSVFKDIINHPVIFFKENKAACEAIIQRKELIEANGQWKMPNQYGIIV